MQVAPPLTTDLGTIDVHNHFEQKDVVVEVISVSCRQMNMTDGNRNWPIEDIFGRRKLMSNIDSEWVVQRPLERDDLLPNWNYQIRATGLRWDLTRAQYNLLLDIYRYSVHSTQWQLDGEKRHTSPQDPI